MFKPFGKNVLVEKIEIERKTTFGIILEASPKTPYETTYARVVAVGPEAVGMEAGDEVAINRKAIHTELLVDDKYYIIVLDTDILGRFKQ